MKQIWVGLLLGGVCALLTVTPAKAHHSFAAEFDSNDTIIIEGTVAKVEWTNPHIWIYVDVESPEGAVAHYQCEGGSPNALGRRGWRKDSLKPGDQVNIDGFRAKRDPYTCNARSVTLVDGIRLFAGSSIENEQQ